MKLRNKKTGEIVEVESLYLTQTQELYLNYINEENNQKVYMTDKIASFNLDWEDYEEPKEYWYIAHNGVVGCFEHDNDWQYMDFNWQDKLKQIGNYFETREEAEKAVEKLKAWKRLKDKGFRFNSWTIPDEPKTPHIKLVIEAEMDVPDSPYDLDLLFSQGDD